ncbi:MAG TPA: hypothetical protein VGE90_17725, partial [Chitinophaga sp.]
MKLELLRLQSAVPHGVGGPGAGTIELIYTKLLLEHKQDAYSYIMINQIGDDLNEVIIKDGKAIHINVRYPAKENFEQLPDKEQNLIRLEIVHMALLRLAEHGHKLDVDKLNEIKSHILEMDFDFTFTYKTFINKKTPELSASVVIKPEVTTIDKCEMKVVNLTSYKAPPVFELMKADIS